MWRVHVYKHVCMYACFLKVWHIMRVNYSGLTQVHELVGWQCVGMYTRYMCHMLYICGLPSKPELTLVNWSSVCSGWHHFFKE